jgi:hypothetical protein
MCHSLHLRTAVKQLTFSPSPTNHPMALDAGSGRRPPHHKQPFARPPKRSDCRPMQGFQFRTSCSPLSFFFFRALNDSGTLRIRLLSQSHDRATVGLRHRRGMPDSKAREATQIQSRQGPSRQIRVGLPLERMQKNHWQISRRKR